jgi:hypothetical protein
MFRPSILVLVLSLAAVACGRDAEPKPPKFSEVMPNVPLPPNATFVSKSGGGDALQLTVRSPAQADVVADYYRQLFKKEGWRLVNDAKDQEGAVVFFAEQDGPPLWVRIRNADDGRGTLVDLAGARVTQKHDSAKVAAPPATAKPTS